MWNYRRHHHQNPRDMKPGYIGGPVGGLAYGVFAGEELEVHPYHHSSTRDYFVEDSSTQEDSTPNKRLDKPWDWNSAQHGAFHECSHAGSLNIDFEKLQRRKAGRSHHRETGLYRPNYLRRSHGFSRSKLAKTVEVLEGKKMSWTPGFFPEAISVNDA